MTVVRTSVTEWILSPGSSSVACRCTECGELTNGPVWKFWDADVATIVFCIPCVESRLAEVASS